MFLLTLLAALVAAEPVTREAAPTPVMRVLYSQFDEKCWHRLDTFESNALCKFDVDAGDPKIRRVWEVVSGAPKLPIRRLNSTTIGRDSGSNNQRPSSATTLIASGE